MFDIVQTKVPVINKYTTKNIKNPISDNFLISLTDNIIINKESTNLKIFNSESFVKMYRNIDLKEEDNISIEIEIIPEQYESENEHIIYTNSNLRSFLSLECNNSNYLYIKLDENKYFYQNNQKVLRLNNPKYTIIINKNKYSNLNILTYKLLTIHKFNPIIDYIIHPFNKNQTFSRYNLLEKGNNDNYIEINSFDINIYPNKVKIYRMIMMFSTDKTDWKKWNNSTSQFESVTFTNSYPTFDEFIQNGNTYNDYINITETDWINEFGNNDIYLLVSSFIPIFEINHSKYNILSDKFIYYKKTRFKDLLLEGDI